MAGNKFGTPFNDVTNSGVLKGGSRATNQNMFNSVMPRLTMPTPAVDTSSTQMWGNISNTLGRVANQSLRDWQEATVKTAAKEGERAGLEVDEIDDVHLAEGNSMRAEGYNNALMQVTANKMNITTQTRLAEIKSKNLDNPEAYAKASSEYIDGLKEVYAARPELSHVAAQVIPQAELRMAANTQDVLENHFKVKQAQFAFDVAESQAQLIAKQTASQGAIFSPNSAKQAAAWELLNADAKTFEISLNAVDPQTGRPIFNSVEKAARIKNFWTKALSANVESIGANPDISTKKLLDIQHGTLMVSEQGPDGQIRQVSIREKIGPEYYDGHVVPAINRRRAMDEAVTRHAEAEQNKAVFSNQVQNYVALSRRVAENDPTLTNAELDLAHSQRLINDQQYVSVSKARMSPPATKTVAIHKVNIQGMLATNAPAEQIEVYMSENASEISPEDRAGVDWALKQREDKQNKAVEKSRLAAFNKAFNSKDYRGITVPSAGADRATLYQIYLNDKANGTADAVAFEHLLDMTTEYNEKRQFADKRAFVQQYGRYITHKPNSNEWDSVASFNNINAAVSKGIMTEEEGNEAKNRIRRMIESETGQPAAIDNQGTQSKGSNLQLHSSYDAFGTPWDDDHFLIELLG